MMNLFELELRICILERTLPSFTITEIWYAYIRGVNSTFDSEHRTSSPLHREQQAPEVT